MFELLLAPLDALLSSLGSGALPGGGPSDQLRATSTVLDGVHGKSTAVTRELGGQWSGGTAGTAVEALQRNGTQNVALSERGVQIATVTDTASGIIRAGYTDLGRVVESFSTVTRVGGAALLTPAGLPALLQSAQEHLSQGLKMVHEVRADLDSETKKLQAVAQAQLADEKTRNTAVAAPKQEVAGKAPGVTSGTTAVSPSGGVQVTLPNGKVVPHQRRWPATWWSGTATWPWRSATGRSSRPAIQSRSRRCAPTTSGWATRASTAQPRDPSTTYGRRIAKGPEMTPKPQPMPAEPGPVPAPPGQPQQKSAQFGILPSQVSAVANTWQAQSSAVKALKFSACNDAKGDGSTTFAAMRTVDEPATAATGSIADRLTAIADRLDAFNSRAVETDATAADAFDSLRAR